MMSKTKGRENNSKGRGDSSKGKPKGKNFNKKYNPGDRLPQRKKVEITFDKSNREEYLTGFSTRKKERRAFGLAMQKVKDRQAKLEERKDNREAQLEKVEEIERNKEELRKGVAGEDDSDDDAGSYEEQASSAPQDNEKEMHTFQDERTTHQFGGLVSVTTTFGIPSDDEDDDVINSKRAFYEREQHGSSHVDTAQKRAGDVQNYIASVKGTMGSKKKNAKQGGKKGQHGAATMKGMGNATTLKMAKKTLSKFKAKGAKGGRGEERSGGGGRGRGGKKGKGRR